MARRPDRRITVGRVVGLFGVRGWVKVYSYTRPREAILQYDPWYLCLAGEWRERALAEGRMQGEGVIARLAGYEDRDTAAALVGADIAILAAQLPPTGEREYYWADLEGLRVVNLAGDELGIVSHLFETGANDVLVVRGERERLIPFADSVVREVDLEAGVLRVDWDAQD
ncbi:MAG TPA: ribosome maturation factor RimM [Burkholderiales bacterium]